MKKTLARALKEKDFTNDIGEDFGKAAATLQSMICKEMCAAYGSSLLAIMDTKSQANG